MQVSEAFLAKHQTTRRKFQAMQELLNGTFAGNGQAAALLKEHLISGDDSIFAFTASVAAHTIPMFEKAERQWKKVADVHAYQSFETPKKYLSDGVISGLTRPDGNPADVAPIVPEGTPYPYFTLKGERLEGGSLHKRGVRHSISWEALNTPDFVDYVEKIPSAMVEAFLNAEEFEVFSALTGSVQAKHQLQAGKNPVTDATVRKNAKLTLDSLTQAIMQLSQRKIDGRKPQINAYTLVVPQGTADVTEMLLSSLSLNKVNAGTLEFNVNNYRPLAKLRNIVDAPENLVPEDHWYLLPAPGGKRPVIELMKLRGHEQVDIRLSGVQGVTLGGSRVGPFEGTFNTDDVEIRGRYPLGGANWTPDLVLYSTGAEA